MTYLTTKLLQSLFKVYFLDLETIGLNGHLLCSRYWCTKCKKRYPSQAALVDHMSYSKEHNFTRTYRYESDSPYHMSYSKKHNFTRTSRYESNSPYHMCYSKEHNFTRTSRYESDSPYRMNYSKEHNFNRTYRYESDSLYRMN